MLKTLIADWRKNFDAENLPFGIVQLVNYGKPSPSSAESKVAPVREAQAAVAREIPGVGLAVTIDLGTGHVHPPDKRDVARRLALWARAEVYGEKNLVFQSPLYQSHSVEGSVVRVRFDTASALTVGKNSSAGLFQETPGAKLEGFEIAGADGQFFQADAQIDGNTVVVSASQVLKPMTVRYAWADNPVGCNLYNKDGLPASPFRIAISAVIMP